MLVKELKEGLENMDDNAPVLFESNDGAGPADASYSIDHVTAKGGFVMLVSND